MEVDVTQKLDRDITIKDREGKKLKQHVEYECKSLFCDKYQKFGHKRNDMKTKKMWIPKAKPPEEDKTPQ